MVQHSKPTEDLNEVMENLNKAMDDIEASYKQYTASVKRALTIAGYLPKAKLNILNKITEHEQMIIKMCHDRKINIR